MGTMAAISFCTVVLLFQPQPSISQTQLGKPGEPAPLAQPAPPPAAAAPVTAPPPVPAAVSSPAPSAPVHDSGGRVAAFWVFLPN